MTRETLAGGWVELEPGFVPDAARAMATLLDELPLREEHIVLFGKPRLVPRLTGWFGDRDAVYRYSGRSFEPEPWTPALAQLRDRLNDLCGVRFNSVLANYYRDGRDSMGAHADDEPELGPSRDDVRIASVSLGSPRRFVMKDRQSGESREWALGDGSLFVMGGRLQERWTHRVPKTKRPVGPRLNLTFRVIVGRRHGAGGP